jgi:hypothetical protein
MHQISQEYPTSFRSYLVKDAPQIGDALDAGEHGEVEYSNQFQISSANTQSPNLLVWYCKS